jgi:hypothetical protein
MTRKISVIVGVVVTALAVSVPVALGQGGPPIAQQDEQQKAVEYFRANEVATLPQLGNQGVPQWMKALQIRGEALDRQYGLGEFAGGSGRDAHDRTSAVVSQGGKGDAHQRSAPLSDRTPVTVTSSGREIEWPQIGIAFGIGLVLLFGVALALKTRRHPPLAH